LLVERISWRGICRVVGAKLKWLLGFLAQCFEALPASPRPACRLSR
jgi:hypothetical protein